MSQQGSRLGIGRLKLHHLIALNTTGTVEIVHGWILTPFYCRPCLLSSLAPQVSWWQVQVHLFPFSPNLWAGNSSRSSGNSSHKVGSGRPQPLLLSSWHNEPQRGWPGVGHCLLTALAAQGLLLVSASSALLREWHCALPALTTLSASAAVGCAIEFWSV